MFLSRLLLSHLISLSVVLADGVEFQLRRRQSSAPSPSPAKHVKPWANGGNGVFRAKDIDDMVYTTDVTVGQQSVCYQHMALLVLMPHAAYTVQLDTGSSGAPASAHDVQHSHVHGRSVDQSRTDHHR